MQQINNTIYLLKMMEFNPLVIELLITILYINLFLLFIM